jgi:peroxiredoxin/quinol monooxygenase YgiN
MTTVSTISDRVAEMHAARPTEPPNELMAVFGREQAELTAAPLPEGLAPLGTTVTDAVLPNVDGEETTLQAVLGDQLSVVVFYRGAWCPYCNIALSTYQSDLRPDLEARGVRLIAISPQTPDGSLSMQQKNELAFTVVSDPGNRIAGQLGILTEPSEEARAAQLQLGLDLTTVNADGTVTLPCPRWPSSTPTAPFGGSTSTPTTAAAPNPSRSSTPSTGSIADLSPATARKAAHMTVQLGILALLEAKQGKGDDLAAFLQAGRQLAVAEEGTVTWYAFKISDTSYGIFDTFETDDARDAHLSGPIAKALAQAGPDLLGADPDLRTVDIVAVK